MKDAKFTRQQLHDLFIYKDGNLWWRDVTGRKASKQGKAAWKNKTGYNYINIGSAKYKQARLIWIMFCGHTEKMIDHINGVRDDDRLENLREADAKDNMWNKSRGRNSATGYRGVTHCKWTGRFVAEVRASGKRVFFKRFDTAEEANEACINARKQFHKEFARHD